MFSQLRRVCYRPILSTYHDSVTVSRRSIFNTPKLNAEEEDAQPDEMSALQLLDAEDAENIPSASSSTYWQWLQNLNEGVRYRDAKPRNWLGGSPFPLNSSFRPPPPVGDKLRTEIYYKYMADPKTNSVRVLAERYHLSINRVDAILRLKGLEVNWVKGKALQTGFLAGMEEILDVSTDQKWTRDAVDSRYDVTEADILDETDGSALGRNRYQLMFWEPVVEGKEPVMPALLEKAREERTKASISAREAKSDAKYMPRSTSGSKPRTRYATLEGHAAVKIVDVGSKFIDTREMDRRLKVREMKARRKDKIRQEKTDTKEQRLEKGKLSVAAAS